MIQGVGEEVPGPLGHHDGDHDQEQLVDVIGDLHHYHSQGHGQPRHAREEGDGAEEGEGPGVHPGPELVCLDPEPFHKQPAPDPAIQTTCNEIVNKLPYSLLLPPSPGV